MTDEGFQLNFAAGDITLPDAPKFRGGNWKERVRLTKGARNSRRDDQRRPPNAYDRAVRAKQNTDNSNENLATKKIKHNDGTVTTLTATRQRHPPPHLVGVAKHGSAGVKEVISSLFTSNPKSVNTESPDNTAAGRENPAKPTNAPLPDNIHTFTSLGLSDTLAAHLLTKLGLKNPTAVQKSAVSQLTKEDADLFIQSETGSGKTLAYLLPIVQRLMTVAARRKYEGSSEEDALHRHSGLFAIILAPTRELCKQIVLVLEKLLGCAHYIVAGNVVGGEKKKSEKARLRKGINILVATPGRLVDHLENTQTLDVSKVRFLVLDEGDRLMDLGFEEDITKIVRRLDNSINRTNILPGMPDRRVTILCSATLKSTVNKLGDLSLRDAVLVKGENENENHSSTASSETKNDAFLAPAQLKQSYIVTPPKQRLVTLTALLKRTFMRKGSVMKAIVFMSCADSVDFHYQVLTRQTSPESLSQQQATPPESDSDSPEHSPALPDALADVASVAKCISSDANRVLVHRLHGSLPQQTRTAIVKSFSTTTQPALLIATDVASRGLDVAGVELVIEYDPAFSKEDHLHRIGRTARLGKDGRAVVFLQPGCEEGYVDILKDSYKRDAADLGSTHVTSSTADEVLRKGFSTASAGILPSARQYEVEATNFQLDVERWVLSEPRVKDLASNAFQSHVRAYATHVASERRFFDIKDLHLGHLAKAFGLRDPPGRVNVAGLRGKGTTKATRRSVVSEGGKQSNDKGRKVDVHLPTKLNANIDVVDDAASAAEKMRAMVRNRKKMMGGGADEFNLA